MLPFATALINTRISFIRNDDMLNWLKMSNQKKGNNDLKKEVENKKTEQGLNLSEDEQLFIYADIIANYIVNEILKNNEEWQRTLRWFTTANG